MTDRDGRAERTCELDARRMSVEGLFRDGKSRRNGRSLRHIRIGSPGRFDRFLLVVALSYILLAGPGLAATLDHDPSAWCTNRRARECSVFTVGKAVGERSNYPPDRVLKMNRRATVEAGSKRGWIQVGSCGYRPPIRTVLEMLSLARR